MATSDSTNSIQRLNIGGTKTACTREKFDTQIEGNLYAQCTLEGVGTLYFIYGDAVGNDDNQNMVYLKFYDEESMVHTSKCVVLQGTKGPLRSCHAIDQNTYCFERHLISLNPDWSGSTFPPLSSSSTSALVAFLSKQTDVQKAGLADQTDCRRRFHTGQWRR